MRSKLADLSPVVHGAYDYSELARLGLSPEEIIDFSANSNPYGPHPAVLTAIQTAVLDPAILTHYPDRDCLALRAAIAAVDQTSSDRILPGNGATELIHLLALTLVEPGSRHLLIAPTFGQYAHAVRLAGGEVVEVRPDNPELRFEVEDVAAAIRRWQPNSIWLCNPNNPTGQQWTAAALAHLRAADATQRAWWVIDESYRYFTAIPTPLADWAEGDNLIILRSLTKDQALAGLRLGYVLAAPAVIAALRAVQPSWSVNGLAQVAGVAALQEPVLVWRQQTLDCLREHALNVWTGLDALGYPVLPTSVPYALVAVPEAAAFRQNLLQQGIQVRDCTSFGLPRYVRIAARRPQENERLLAAVKSS